MTTYSEGRADMLAEMIEDFATSPRKCRTAMVMAAKKARKERMKLGGRSSTRLATDGVRDKPSFVTHPLKNGGENPRLPPFPTIWQAVLGMIMGVVSLVFMYGGGK